MVECVAFADFQSHFGSTYQYCVEDEGAIAGVPDEKLAGKWF